MKFPVLFAIIVLINYSAAADEDVKPAQPLLDLQNLRNTFQIKNEAIGRFFKLLSNGFSSTTTEKPTSVLDFIPRGFRRLNIFGLQNRQEEPPKNVDGSPLSQEVNEHVPEILHVTPYPASKRPGPNFVIIQPGTDKLLHDFGSNEEPTIYHYPKLNLHELFPRNSISSHYQEPHEGYSNLQYHQK